MFDYEKDIKMEIKGYITRDSAKIMGNFVEPGFIEVKFKFFLKENPKLTTEELDNFIRSNSAFIIRSQDE